MKYVRMDETHVEQVARLEADCFSNPWSLHSITSELNNPLSLWFVAIEGDKVVGYVGSQFVLDEADMMNLAVSENYRHQRIGENLVNVLVEHLKKRFVKSLTLEVRISNEPAIHLYEKLGFLQVGCRPRYYVNPREDALILRKEWEV